MILAIDAGNTNIVFGCIENGNILFKSRISTDRNKTETEYAVVFKNIIEIHDIDVKCIDGVILSSVVPPLNGVLSQAMEMITEHTPIIVNVKQNTGLRINMDNEKQLGNDLIVDAVAALDRFEPPILIIDMGTATTISIIDKDGVYSGTVIIPGMQVSQDALSARTSQLPSIGFEAPPNIIGKNTIDCMKSGLIYGTASMIDGMIERLEEELGQKAAVVATGGLVETVIDFCKKDIVYDDDLLLKGLWLIYNRQ